MDKKLARVVNRGFAGEPEHIVFQIKETLQCVEFSQIKFVNENGGAIREVSLVDAVIDQPEVLHVLNNMAHECEISINESNEATIYF